MRVCMASNRTSRTFRAIVSCVWSDPEGEAAGLELGRLLAEHESSPLPSSSILKSHPPQPPYTNLSAYHVCWQLCRYIQGKRKQGGNIQIQGTGGECRWVIIEQPCAC